MLFSTLAIVVPLLFHAVSAAPTARTATCPDAKVWGASDPSVTWVIVGYERDLRLTDPNNPAFDTEYQLLSNCPSGGGTVSWWVEDATTCGAVGGSLQVTSITIHGFGGPGDYHSYFATGNGSAPITVECPAGGTLFALASLYGNVAAQSNVDTLWALNQV